jgi:hypothetical protein
MLGLETQERSLWTRASGNLLEAGGEGAVWIGSDQWPGILAGGGTAESLPIVSRATAIITGPLTAAPFVVSDGSQPRWLTDPQLLRGDARLVDGLQAVPAALRLPRAAFWTELIRNALWYGMGYLLFQEDSSGAPLAGTLRLANPLLVGTENGRWVLGSGEDRAEFDRDGRLVVGMSVYRMVCLRNPGSPVDQDGRARGVFELHRPTFDQVLAVDSYVAGTFRSGVPSGYLKVEQQGMTQPQADELKRKWLESHGGDRRSIAVLNSTTSFQPISFSPVDAEATQVSRLSMAKVAMAFNVDPAVLGLSLANSSTYISTVDSWERLKAFSLQPMLSAVEDLLTSLVPQGTRVDVDLSPFAAESTPVASPPAPPATAPTEGDQ